MELRAREDTSMSQDMIYPIRPIAASLHDAFLRSHCSSCFRPVTHRSPACCLLYCSPRCSSADHHRHVSSGECRLLRSLPELSNRSPAGTADLRAALRLLHSLELLGLLPSLRSDRIQRLGGLLSFGANGGGEIAERLREVGSLLARARNTDPASGDHGLSTVEAAAIWAVVMNAVEVHVGIEGAVGIAVYGPQFSWFNHSCSPNACFRFELFSPFDPQIDSCRIRVSPSGEEETTAAAWEAWSVAESKLNQGLCDYGPRVVVRSIKPIKKHEEVCVAYIDLLQPKADRHLDLWSKYQFVCCCERCDASPQMYIDYILSCDTPIPNLDRSEELAECLNRAIDRYMSDGNSETCCENLENLLCGNFQEEKFQMGLPHRKSKLQPLHHLSLNAYIVVASAYRVRASNSSLACSGEEDVSEGIKMRRAAAAYSLLLAGATHHLLLSEASLIASAALFFSSTGESLLGLIRSIQGSTNKMSEAKFCMGSCHSQCMVTKGSSVPFDEFEAVCRSFRECLSRFSSKTWLCLAQGFPYLESIKSPVNFGWLRVTTIKPQVLSGGWSCGGDTSTEADDCAFFQLAVHCLFYSRYLATICYGSKSYLAEHAVNLLRGVVLDRYIC